MGLCGPLGPHPPRALGECPCSPVGPVKRKMQAMSREPRRSWRRARAFACALTAHRCLRSDTFEEDARRLVAGILIGEPALEGPLEDGLAEASAAADTNASEELSFLDEREQSFDFRDDPALLHQGGDGYGQAAQLRQVDRSKIGRLLSLLKEVLLPGGVAVPGQELGVQVVCEDARSEVSRWTPYSSVNFRLSSGVR